MKISEEELRRRQTVTIVNSRMMSLTLNDPTVRAEVQAASAELRKDPEKLKHSYIDMGFLNEDGTLHERYGGEPLKFKKRKAVNK